MIRLIRLSFAVPYRIKAKIQRFSYGISSSLPKLIKQRAPLSPMVVLDLAVFLLFLWGTIAATTQAWLRRSRNDKLDAITAQVLFLERHITSISREGFSQGRRTVAYSDIGLASRTIERALRIIAALTRVAGSAADLAKQLGDKRFKKMPNHVDRYLLLIEGKALLRNKDFAGAAAFARRSLMIHAVCVDTQRLLHDALLGLREQGSTVSPTDISLDDLSDRFCERPFTTLVTGSEGRAFLCDCPAYLPVPTGNILYSNSAEDVWNSAVAQEVRRSIHDGDFSYCSRTLCSVLKDGALKKKSAVTDAVLRKIIDERQLKLETGPRSIQLSHDPSCNLACPSCRSEIITLKGSELATYEAARDRVVMPLLQRTEGTLMVSGGGDPFASKHYRSILSAIDHENYKNLTISILTNALVLTPKQWSEFKGAHPLIRSLLVSVDAARADTYFDVRRPGRFERLIPNLEFLGERRRAGDFALFGLCFVVQEKNFREMPEFVDLGRRLGVDLIWFQRLVNFGTFDEQGLRDADVADPGHAHHGEYQQVLADPRMKDPSVHLFSAFLTR